MPSSNLIWNGLTDIGEIWSCLQINVRDNPPYSPSWGLSYKKVEFILAYNISHVCWRELSSWHSQWSNNLFQDSRGCIVAEQRNHSACKRSQNLFTYYVRTCSVFFEYSVTRIYAPLIDESSRIYGSFLWLPTFYLVNYLQ